MTIIDGSSGERQDFVIGGADRTPTSAGSEHRAATAMAGINPRLLETSRYGMIPVVADGLKPFTVYAGGNDDPRQGRDDAGDRHRRSAASASAPPRPTTPS